MYQAFISSHCQGEIMCSFRAYPYGGFGKDSWKRPCLCWTPSLPHTSVLSPLTGDAQVESCRSLGSLDHLPQQFRSPHFLFFGCGFALGQGERRKWVCSWFSISFSEALKGLGVFPSGFKGLGVSPSCFKDLLLVSGLYSRLCDLSSWPTALLQFQLNKLFLIFCLFTFAASC